MRKGLALATTGGDPFSIYATMRGMFLADERRALLGRTEERATAPSAFDGAIADWLSAPGGDSIEAYGLFDLTNYLRNTLLRDTDAMGMAHALEVREPLIDHRLVELAMRLPGSMKLERGRNKPLLARAVPELPREASTRPKMGFTLPLEAWLHGPLRSWAEERLFSDSGSVIGPLNGSALKDLWRAFQRGRRYVSVSRMWTVIALTEWCRANAISA
jgi:asparagine synthase (glutamine-hydrolysing)